MVDARTEEFRRWLTAYMTETGMSQAMIARKAGTSASAVNRWVALTRPSTPTPDNARALEKALGLRSGFLREMLGYSDPGENDEVELPIIPEIADLLAAMPPDDQREYVLPAIELAELYRRRGRGRDQQ